MPKLCPKSQYLVWPPLFPSTALNVLGMEFTRASQVATGDLFHSSVTTSRSWWMLETLRSSIFLLRMPHRCSIGFRSKGWGLETCLASPSPLPSASLAWQWSLSCWNTSLRPSLQSEGIMLCFSMSPYMLAFMVPSMNCSSIWHHLNQIHLSWSHQTTGHGSSNLCPLSSCLHQTVCRLSCASSLEEASFCDDSHADQFDAVCGIWSDHWQADPPPISTSAAILAALIPYFPNTTSGYDAEHVHSTPLVDHGEACSKWNLSC